MKDKVKKIISDMECTAFPEGNWHDCCVAHDYAYAEGENKWKADAKLTACVAKKGHPLVAAVIWMGCTLFAWKAYNDHKEARGDS